MYRSFNAFSTRHPVLHPRAFPNVFFYERLINNSCQTFVENSWLFTTSGEFAWGNVCSPCFTHCYHLIPNLLPTNREGEEPTTSCRFGISHTTDWIILTFGLLLRQKTQLLRSSSLVCPPSSMESARAPLGLLQTAHLGPPSCTLQGEPPLFMPLFPSTWIKTRDILCCFISFFLRF